MEDIKNKINMKNENKFDGRMIIQGSLGKSEKRKTNVSNENQEEKVKENLKKK